MYTFFTLNATQTGNVHVLHSYRHSNRKCTRSSHLPSLKQGLYSPSLLPPLKQEMYTFFTLNATQTGNVILHFYRHSNRKYTSSSLLPLLKQSLDSPSLLAPLKQGLYSPSPLSPLKQGLYSPSLLVFKLLWLLLNNCNNNTYTSCKRQQKGYLIICLTFKPWECNFYPFNESVKTVCQSFCVCVSCLFFLSFSFFCR